MGHNHVLLRTICNLISSKLFINRKDGHTRILNTAIMLGPYYKLIYQNQKERRSNEGIKRNAWIVFT